MKKMYKCLSFVLSFMMILSAVVIVTAESGDVTLQEADYRVAKRLAAIGILDEVNPEDMLKNPTRREVAELMVRFINLPVVEQEAKTSPFLDVPPSAEGFSAISALYQMGCISRDTDLKFYPDRTVSANEAVTFVVKSMGYKVFADANGGYPTGYFYVASRYDLLKNVKLNGTEPIYNFELYHMIDKALEAPALEYVGYVEGADRYSVDKTQTIMAKFWQGYQKNGIVTGNSATSLNQSGTTLDENEIKIDDTVYRLATEVSEELLGKTVTFFALKVKDDVDTLVYIEENTKKNRTWVLEDRMPVPEKTTNRAIVYYDTETEKEKTVDLEVNCNVIYNGVYHGAYYNVKQILPAYGYMELIDNNANDRVDVIKVYDYKNMVVSFVDTHDEIIYERDANDCDIFYGGDVSFTLLDGETKEDISVDKLSYGDVITFAKSADENRILAYVSRKTAEGKVTAVTELADETVYTIDGTDYKTAKDGAKEIPLGTQGIFKLDYFGNIFEVTYNTQENGDYLSGVLMGITDGGKGISASARLKLFLTDGTVAEYDTKETVSVDGERTEMKHGAAREYIAGFAGQMVRIKVKDGKVFEVDTAYMPDKSLGQTTSDYLGTLTTIASGTQIQRRSFVYRMSRDFNFYVHGNANLILVPTDPLDEENYVLTTPSEFLKNGHTYTATGASGTYTNVLPNLKVQVYNLGTPQNEGEIGTTIVMQCDPISAWAQGGNFRVVTKITRVYDEELQQEATRLYFDENSSAYYTVSDTVRFINNTGKTQFSQLNLKVGDVVTIGLDHDQIIKTIQIWYRMDQTNTQDVTLRQGKWTNSTNYDAQPLRAVGTVKAVDTAKKIISYQTPDGAENWMMTYSSPTIWLVRSDIERTGKLEKLTPASLKPGDRIVLSASLASCTHIVVYR